MTISGIKSFSGDLASDLLRQTTSFVIKNPKITGLATVALLGIPGVAAGPITYAACYAGCNAAVLAGTLTPAGLVLCFEACLPLLAPFCP